MKLWGGRFETGPSEVFERFGRSIHFDGRLIDCDCRGSQAFAVLQREEAVAGEVVALDGGTAMKSLGLEDRVAALERQVQPVITR